MMVRNAKEKYAIVVGKNKHGERVVKVVVDGERC